MGEITDYGKYILIHKGEIPGMHGVGFMIKNQYHNNIIEFIGLSERIAILNMNIPTYKDPWSLIQIYAPTEKAKPEIKNKFYEELTTALNKLHKNVIIMGDFNSQIGSRFSGVENSLVKWGK